MGEKTIWLLGIENPNNVDETSLIMDTFSGLGGLPFRMSAKISDSLTPPLVRKFTQPLLLRLLSMSAQCGRHKWKPPFMNMRQGKRLVESKGVKWRVNRSRRPSESYHFADEEDRFAGRPARSQARAKL